MFLERTVNNCNNQVGVKNEGRGCVEVDSGR